MVPMKISLAHPGVGPFVQQTAQALSEAEMLAAYWTTFCDQPGASWRKLAVGVSRALGFDLEGQLQRRAITSVPLELVRSDPVWEVVRSILSKASADSRLVDAVWERGILRFDRRVAELALQHADAIYGYEYSALRSFREAQRRRIARIYEVPAPEHDFVEKIIQHEIEQFPELNDGRRSYFVERQERRTERRRQEWNLADVIIANSAFTKQSYAAAGLDVSKVHVIPLGAPGVNERGLAGGSRDDAPLKVLWAGTFSIRKGAHYLLRGWRSLAPKQNAGLQIVGSIAVPERILRNLPSSIVVSPTMGKASLFELYRTADVLIFPTLCDGFGMVVTEAFSQGLPVITTSRAGAAEIVRSGENGIVIPAADAVAIAGALDWCMNHRAELREMRRGAIEAAARWQWPDFRRELIGHLISGLKEAGY
jgi:glycosyltransferase involved in cell wall biosynthesis